MTKRNVQFCRTGEQGATDIMVEGLGRYVPYNYHEQQMDKRSNATLAMRIKELTDEVMRLNNELNNDSYNEAISYALKENDLCFLSCWNEGEWEAIAREWLDFPIDTPAQRRLITESGSNIDALIKIRRDAVSEENRL